MSVIRSALFIAALACMPLPGLSQEFLKAPPKLKEVEAAGLPRVSIEELKQFIPGKMDTKGPLGRHIKTFRPDGTADRVGHGSGHLETCTWRFDEANNTYCNTFRGKKSIAENCFAIFRAPDGTHSFDYDVDTGFFQRTWRRISE